MMSSSAEKFGDLLERIARLRDPTDGCPWDRAQDHASLRPYMLEEAYEAIAAIDSGRPEALKDELGDVLLQVVLHAQIASEQDEFTIADVVDGLIDKLVRRHPHVFSDATGDLPEVLDRWHRIKASEKAHKPQLPVLLAARKFVDEYMVRGGQPLDPAGLDAEEREGWKILRAIAHSWSDGFEPEIALRKAMAAFRTTVTSREESA